MADTTDVTLTTETDEKPHRQIDLKAAGKMVVAVNKMTRATRKCHDGTTRPAVASAKKQEKAHKCKCAKEKNTLWGSLVNAAYAPSTKTNAFLEHTYHHLGNWIGKNHKLSMLIGFLIIASGIPGTFLLEGKCFLLWIHMDTGFEPFAHKENDQYRNWEAYHQQEMYQPTWRGYFQLVPKEGTAQPFSYEYMSNYLTVLNHVYNMAVDVGGTTYSYTDLCQPVGGVPVGAVTALSQCLSTGFDFFLPTGWDQDTLTAMAGTDVAAEALGDSTVHDYAYALTGLAAAMGPLTNATAIFRLGVGLSEHTANAYTHWAPTFVSSQFLLADTDELLVDPQTSTYSTYTVKEASEKWTKEMMTYLKSDDFPSDTFDVQFFTDSSITEELQRLLWVFVPFLIITIGVMASYATAFLFSQTRQKPGECTQITLIFSGSMVSTLAGFSGLGWLYYFGWTISILNVMAVFLVAAVGVDCTFIFCSAMKAAGPEVEVHEAMGLALAEGATAVTLTTGTSVVAFTVAAITSTAQEAFVKFNVTMAIALTLNFLGFIFFFGGLMVFNELKIKEGKNEWFFTKKPDFKVPEKFDFASKLRKWINETYAPLFVTSVPFKLGGVAVLFGSLAVAAGCIPMIGTGISQSAYQLTDGILPDLFKGLDSHNQGMQPHQTFLHVTGLDLNSQTALDLFHDNFMAQVLARNNNPVVNCLPTTLRSAGYPTYDAFLQDPTAYAQFSDAVSVDSTVADFGSGAALPDVVTCTILFLEDVVKPESTERIEAMDFYMDLVDELNAAMILADDPTVVYLASFNWAITTALDKLSPSLCWNNVIIALISVAVVLAFALPLHNAIIGVLNIAAVVVSVMGFIGYVGFAYNLLILCVMVMSIGFCVDYTVEILHFSSLAPEAPYMGEKIQFAMRAAGYDVLHGSATGFLGCIMLTLIPAGAPTIFGIATLVMVFYGAMFSLWCMPALLCTIDDVARMVSGKLSGKPATPASQPVVPVSTQSA